MIGLFPLALLTLTSQDLPKIKVVPVQLRIEKIAIPQGKVVRWPKDGYRTIYKNASRSPVNIWITHFFTNHRVVLRDKFGNEPKLTKEGERSRQFLEKEYITRDSTFPIEIQPGKEFIFDVRISPSDLYVLAKGDYTLTVEYDEKCSDLMHIYSNPLPFHFDPKK